MSRLNHGFTHPYLHSSKILMIQQDQHRAVSSVGNPRQASKGFKYFMRSGKVHLVVSSGFYHDISMQLGEVGMGV